MLNVDGVVSSLDDRKIDSLGVGEDTRSVLVVSCGANMSDDGNTSDGDTSDEDVITIEVSSGDEASKVAIVDVSAADKDLAVTSDVLLSSIDIVPRDEDLDNSMLSERDDSLLRGDNIDTTKSPLVVWIRIEDMVV